MAEKQLKGVGSASGITGIAVAVFMIAILVAMFVGMPKVIIDLCMALNLAIAFFILLYVLFLRSAADFASFPRLMIIVTIFGTSINVSSTRNILFNPIADGGMKNQSELVKTMADLVCGGNVVVGIIMFIIIIVFQKIVVNKGADRIGEVRARFELDGMSHKNFTLQTKLNLKLITEEEFDFALTRLQKQNEFYSAMDGASKFVSGNVTAGIFITIINIIGGVITGVMAGSNVGTAFSDYAKLTVGDGLMSQIPALIVSISSGLLISGTESDENLSQMLFKEFTVDGKIYMLVGGILALMALAFHNGSSLVLIILGSVFLYVGQRLSSSLKQKATEEAAAGSKDKAVQTQSSGEPKKVAPYSPVDALSLEVGFSLISLLTGDQKNELLSRVEGIREEIGNSLGIVVPKIHIIDNINLEPDEYAFKFRDVEFARNKLKVGHVMCLDTGVPDSKKIVAERTKDPSFGMDAIWLPDTRAMEAEKAGYTVIDLFTIIATHITELIRKNASIILTRQMVSEIIEKVGEDDRVLVDEILSGEHKLGYGIIQAVLKNLLLEQVSIRDMVTILETLADNSKFTTDPWELSEKVREALGAQICQQYADRDTKTLKVIYFNQQYASKLLEYKSYDPSIGPVLALNSEDGRKFINAVGNALSMLQNHNILPVIMCPSEIRRIVKQGTEMEMPGLIVISVSEAFKARSTIRIESALEGVEINEN